MKSILKLLISISIIFFLGAGVLLLKSPNNRTAYRNWSSFITVPLDPRTPLNIGIDIPTDNISGIGVYAPLLNRGMQGTVVFSLWEKAETGAKKKKILYTKEVSVQSLSNNKGLTTFYFSPVKVDRDKNYGFTFEVGEGKGYYLHRAYNVYYYKPLWAQIKESTWGRYGGTDIIANPWLTVALFLALLLTGGWLLKEFVFETV